MSYLDVMWLAAFATIGVVLGLLISLGVAALLVIVVAVVQQVGNDE